jgi:hypothetical protein
MTEPSQIVDKLDPHLQAFRLVQFIEWCGHQLYNPRTLAKFILRCRTCEDFWYGQSAELLADFDLVDCLMIISYSSFEALESLGIRLRAKLRRTLIPPKSVFG